jgi:hypothetical protein
VKNEMYGTLRLDVSRITDCENHELAELESQSVLNEFNIEEVLLETMRQLGLKLHNANIKWERFFGEDE